MGVSDQPRAPQRGRAGLGSAKSPADSEGNKGAGRAPGTPVWQCQPRRQGGGYRRSAARSLKRPAARSPPAVAHTALTLAAVWPRERLTHCLHRPGPHGGFTGLPAHLLTVRARAEPERQMREEIWGVSSFKPGWQKRGGEAGSASILRTPSASPCCATKPGQTLGESEVGSAGVCWNEE